MSSEKWKVVGVILLATLAVSIGETLLAKGMKQTNGVTGDFWAQLKGVLNPGVIFGTMLMASYFGLYMLALKWADISFVLPFTALSYLIVALLAKFYLHETVTPSRWLGVAIIMLGVVVVGIGEGGGSK